MLSKGVTAAKVVFFKIFVNSKSLFLPLILTVEVLVAVSDWDSSKVVVDKLLVCWEVWVSCWTGGESVCLINGLSERGTSLSFK